MRFDNPAVCDHHSFFQIFQHVEDIEAAPVVDVDDNCEREQRMPRLEVLNYGSRRVPPRSLAVSTTDHRVRVLVASFSIAPAGPPR
jgi:hypothetical protein